MFHIFIFIIIIILCLYFNRTLGGKERKNEEKIEYLDVTFPIEKNVPIKSCEKQDFHMPDYCVDLKIQYSRELPDFPESVKTKITLETYAQQFNASLIHFSDFLSFFYLIAEVLVEKKYPEIIIIGTHGGVVPFVLAEYFKCKIYYFTIKPLIKQVKNNKLIEIFHRFPNEKDFEKLRGLPLFNFSLFIEHNGNLNDMVNSQIYSFVYANYIAKSFQPIFSLTTCHLIHLESRQSIILPKGKLLWIPYMYYQGDCFIIETTGKICETIYDFADIRKRVFLLVNCIRPLNYDHIRVSKIPGYKKIKKVTDKIIGVPLEFEGLTREEYLQKNSCYQKEYSFAPGKFLAWADKIKDYKYTLYIDGIWYEMPKMKYIPFEYIADILLSEQLINMQKEKKEDANITICKNYKQLFLIGFYDLKSDYAYFIKDKCETYLTHVKIPKMHFYTDLKSEKEFCKLAKKNNQIVIGEDFYRPELVEPCALMLQTIWGNNPYPYRCFIPDSMMLRNILAEAFADATIYVNSKNPKYDSVPRTIRIDNISDTIRSGDYLFEN